MVEEQLHAVPSADLGRLADAGDQPLPGVCVTSRERIVVGLEAKPDDQVGPERARELGRLANQSASLAADACPRMHETAAAEPRVEVQTAGDAVDVMGTERRPDLVEVLVRPLVDVELVVSLVSIGRLHHRLLVVPAGGAAGRCPEWRDRA